MEKKVCIKCKEKKDVTEFYSSNKSSCKVCLKDYQIEYRQNNKERLIDYQIEYRQNNKERLKIYYENNKQRLKEYKKVYDENNKERLKEYRKNNKERITEYSKKYIQNNKERLKEYKQNNKERLKEYRKIYYENNKEREKQYRQNNIDKIILRSNEYCRVRRQSDTLFKLTTNIRNIIVKSLKNKGYLKESKTHLILGITYEEFKTHIESQWEEWMNWDNYGKYNGEENYGWDLDHIIPLSSGKSEEDIIRLNHYSNIQPLCSYVNRVVKKDKKL